MTFSGEPWETNTDTLSSFKYHDGLPDIEHNLLGDNVCLEYMISKQVEAQPFLNLKTIGVSKFSVSTTMGWDEVCIVCGICPSSDLGKAGPRWLLDNYYGEEEYLNITAEVVAINNDDFEETLAIVSEALSLPIYEDDETIHRLRKVMPGLCDWSGFKRCVAIGQFDGEGTTLVDDGSGYCRIPDGRQVEVRLVDGFRAGTFRWVIKEKQDGVTEELEEYSECSAYMSIFGERGHGQPNFFVTEGCYHYLQAWIDWAALSPRKRAFPSDPTPLSFGAELYEIVNSEEDLRGE